jgi:hypothetical protein
MAESTIKDFKDLDVWQVGAISFNSSARGGSN